MSEMILNPADNSVFVQRQRETDPVMGAVSTPSDFSAQYPTPLDPTEILALCEEVSVLNTIPEKRTGLKVDLWREMTSLEFVSGSSYIAFSDGYCPEPYEHDGENKSVTLKNIGIYKSLTVSDIMHSAAVAGANWNGINTLVAGGAASSGMPGGSDATTFMREYVANVKEKEVRLGTTLLLNGWDRLLIQGNSAARPLEFDGIERWFGAGACTGTYHDSASTTGTFSQSSFDQWLSEACAKPTHIFGHPTAIQELLSGYFAQGFNGSQIVNFTDGNRIVPGFNFASFVNTGVGRLALVADVNFTRTDLGGGRFQASLYALRMTHNGEPLVYRTTQIPLSYQDLAPGCTAVAFEVWAKTALVIKNCCMHGKYTAGFTGRTSGVTSCTQIG